MEVNTFSKNITSVSFYTDSETCGFAVPSLTSFPWVFRVWWVCLCSPLRTHTQAGAGQLKNMLARSLPTNQMILQGHHGNTGILEQTLSQNVTQTQLRLRGIGDKEDQLDLDSKLPISYLLCDLVQFCMPTGTSNSFLRWGFKTKPNQTKHLLSWGYENIE